MGRPYSRSLYNQMSVYSPWFWFMVLTVEIFLLVLKPQTGRTINQKQQTINAPVDRYAF